MVTAKRKANLHFDMAKHIFDDCDEPRTKISMPVNSLYYKWHFASHRNHSERIYKTLNCCKCCFSFDRYVCINLVCILSHTISKCCCFQNLLHFKKVTIKPDLWSLPFILVYHLTCRHGCEQSGDLCAFNSEEGPNLPPCGVEWEITLTPHLFQSLWSTISTLFTKIIDHCEWNTSWLNDQGSSEILPSHYRSFLFQILHNIYLKLCWLKVLGLE